MQRAINLKAQAEEAGRFTYDVVMVSRWDVLWNRPFLFSRMDLSGNAFLLPTFCTHEHHIDHKSQTELSINAFKTTVCGGRHSRTTTPTASQSCHPEHRPCSGDLSDQARELYLLDWWFVSSSRAADAFAIVADPPLFANYTLLNSQRLNHPKIPRAVIMGHAYWGMHMVWGLHSPLRFVASLSTDFSLSRVWKRDGNCRGLRAACQGPTCAYADIIRRPWQDATALGAFGGKMPQRKPPVFKYGADQTRYSCGVGYFTCFKASKMCDEEMQTWEPMDHTSYRQAWIDCTADVCPRLGFTPYSARCAGAMLGTWAMIWKHATLASNTTLAEELAAAGGVADGMAVGVHDPRHAAAALHLLLKQSGDMLHSPTYKGAATSLAKVGSQCPNVTLNKERGMVGVGQPL